MKLSPFPGMDPYLEKHWGDIHHRLIQYSADAMQPELPDGLRARVEERVFLESPDSGKTRAIAPDVSISQTPGFDPPMPWQPGQEPDQEEGELLLAEPIIFESEEVTEGYIEIRDRTGGKLITAIEFVSPSNRRTGEGRIKYLQKQEEVMASDASLVEIDLVRRGKSVISLPNEEIPELDGIAYAASITVGWDLGRWEVYPIPLRQRLRALPIPLRQNEPRIHLDLQSLINQAYLAGRYDDIDYAKSAEPKLNKADRKWAKGLISGEDKEGS